jgi:hypothetical protein
MANIEKETLEVPVQNKVIVVGITPVLVNPARFRFMKGVILYVPSQLDPVPNTAPIWLGNNLVTPDLAIDTGGFPLVPGSQITFPTDYLDGLFAVSTAADQHLIWIGV